MQTWDGLATFFLGVPAPWKRKATAREWYDIPTHCYTITSHFVVLPPYVFRWYLHGWSELFWPISNVHMFLDFPRFENFPAKGLKILHDGILDKVMLSEIHRPRN